MRNSCKPVRAVEKNNKADWENNDPHDDLYNPLAEAGWDCLKWSGSKRGIHASDWIYACKLRGVLKGNMLIREPGTICWRSIDSQEDVLRERAIARTAWKLFNRMPGIRWFYKTEEENIYGPFSSQQMWKWFQGGLLYKSLHVAGQKEDSSFLSKFVVLDSLLVCYLLKDIEAHSEFVPPTDKDN